MTKERERILDLVRKLVEDLPEYRIGQILSNSLWLDGAKLYFMEDSKMLELLEILMNGWKQRGV